MTQVKYKTSRLSSRRPSKSQLITCRLGAGLWCCGSATSRCITDGEVLDVDDFSCFTCTSKSFLAATAGGVDVAATAAGGTVVLWCVTLTSCFNTVLQLRSFSWLTPASSLRRSSSHFFVCSRLASNSCLNSCVVCEVLSSSHWSRFFSALAPSSCSAVSSSWVEMVTKSVLRRVLSATSSVICLDRWSRSRCFSDVSSSTLTRLACSWRTWSVRSSNSCCVWRHSAVLDSTSLVLAANVRSLSAKWSRDSVSDASSDVTDRVIRVTMASLRSNMSAWRLIVCSLSLLRRSSCSRRRLRVYK